MTVNEVIQTFISPVCILILGIYLNKKTAKATEQEDTKEKLWLLTVRGLTACMSLTLQLAEEITEYTERPQRMNSWKKALFTQRK